MSTSKDIVSDTENLYEVDEGQQAADAVQKKSTLSLEALWEKYGDDLAKLSQKKIELSLFNMGKMKKDALDQGKNGLKIGAFKLKFGKGTADNELNIKRFQALVGVGLTLKKLVPSALVSEGTPMYQLLPKSIQNQVPLAKYLLLNGCHLFYKMYEGNTAAAHDFKKEITPERKFTLVILPLLQDWIAYSRGATDKDGPSRNIRFASFVGQSELRHDAFGALLSNNGMVDPANLLINQQRIFLWAVIESDETIRVKGGAQKKRYADFIQGLRPDTK